MKKYPLCEKIAMTLLIFYILQNIAFIVQSHKFRALYEEVMNLLPPMTNLVLSPSFTILPVLFSILLSIWAFSPFTQNEKRRHFFIILALSLVLGINAICLIGLFAPMLSM